MVLPAWEEHSAWEVHPVWEMHSAWEVRRLVIFAPPPMRVEEEKGDGDRDNEQWEPDMKSELMRVHCEERRFKYAGLFS